MSHDLSHDTDPTPVGAAHSVEDSHAVSVYAEHSHPVPDPGLEPHVERYTDANKHAGRRAYAQVVGLLALAPLLAIAFSVCYFAIPRDAVLKLGPLHSNASTTALSLTGGLMVACIGFACIHWAKQIMNDAEIVDERHPLVSDPAERAAFLKMYDDGVADSRIGRRKLIGAGLVGGLGLAAAPAILILSDMGPYATPTNIRNSIGKTIWAEGVRLVNDVDYTPIKASQMEIGQLINGEPENMKDVEGADRQVDTAKAAIIVVRMDPASIKIPDSRKNWQVGGILAYSKICTHVGCPISLWERTTHHLLCPCHQSTFDLGDSGVVVFGPAARALPQLPITVDSDGYLVARSDFTVPVGPSYFERDSRHDFKKGDN